MHATGCKKNITSRLTVSDLFEKPFNESNRYLFTLAETPRIVNLLSQRFRSVSSDLQSLLIMALLALMQIRSKALQKLSRGKFTCCFRKTRLRLIFTMQTYKEHKSDIEVFGQFLPKSVINLCFAHECLFFDPYLNLGQIHD